MSIYCSNLTYLRNTQLFFLQSTNDAPGQVSIDLIIHLFDCQFYFSEFNIIDNVLFNLNLGMRDCGRPGLRKKILTFLATPRQHLSRCWSLVHHQQYLLLTLWRRMIWRFVRIIRNSFFSFFRFILQVGNIFCTA